MDTNNAILSKRLARNCWHRHSGDFCANTGSWRWTRQWSARAARATPSWACQVAGDLLGSVKSFSEAPHRNRARALCQKDIHSCDVTGTKTIIKCGQCDVSYTLAPLSVFSPRIILYPCANRLIRERDRKLGSGYLNLTCAEARQGLGPPRFHFRALDHPWGDTNSSLIL